ncbi:AzlC family ABC transporter permease [Eubacterium barkeri]|uniref:4-azaleucine resistance probable transporter AzlC n=1 Tax=Eubacterium barkeri TaxID=1528 RepID=A0A1H3HKW2_EUBBA|nr:AzlC family ABC transporter permease [Eubacterium barkeri]SDY15865.1 4-azaleucine resistance probable transporter AzlC [Eubacterium barkeri]
MKNTKKLALKAAFPHTLPILAGFLFLGMAYGIYAHSLGFSFVYPMVMALTIFAGSMEFVAMDLLLGAFNPLGAFLLALMVNARHLFYGIAMLGKYGNTGKKKGYLIFGMCDESFSINCTAAIPQGVDAGWFMFFVTLLNQIYWVLGATLGGLIGNIIPFDTQGLDFVMTALFIVLFLEQWFKDKNHTSAVIGIVVSVVTLILLGGSTFIIPAMVFILALLILLRSRLDQEVEK